MVHIQALVAKELGLNIVLKTVNYTERFVNGELVVYKLIVYLKINKEFIWHNFLIVSEVNDSENGFLTFLLVKIEKNRNNKTNKIRFIAHPHNVLRVNNHIAVEVIVHHTLG